MQFQNGLILTIDAGSFFLSYIDTGILDLILENVYFILKILDIL